MDQYLYSIKNGFNIENIMMNKSKYMDRQFQIFDEKKREIESQFIKSIKNQKNKLIESIFKVLMMVQMFKPYEAFAEEVNNIRDGSTVILSKNINQNLSFDQFIQKVKDDAVDKIFIDH